MPSSVTLLEGDDFEAVLPGVTFAFARTADGQPSHIHNLVDPSVSIHRFDTGFAMDGVGQLHGDTVGIALPVGRSSPRTLWEGREVSLDEVVIYGPRAGHAATYGVGWDVLIATLKWDAVQRAAESLGVEIGDPSGRRARGGGQALERFRSTLVDRSGDLDPGVDPDEVIRAVVGLLVDGQREPRSARSGSSTQIVKAAIDSLEATGSWFPSIIELCTATNVSERRLRIAFVDCFDVPPSVFLRQRALAAASAEICRTRPEEATITEIAHAHGFRHMPSFARYHREAFGDLPSAVRPPSRTPQEHRRDSTRG